MEVIHGDKAPEDFIPRRTERKEFRKPLIESQSRRINIETLAMWFLV